MRKKKTERDKEIIRVFLNVIHNFVLESASLVLDNVPFFMFHGAILVFIFVPGILLQFYISYSFRGKKDVIIFN